MDLLARISAIIEDPLRREKYFRKQAHRWSARRSFLLHFAQSTWRRARMRRPAPLRLGIGLVEHMGDIVAAEPILRQLRLDHPDADITWCLRAPFRGLLEHHPALDRTLVVPCLTEWILLRESAVFDKVVDLHMQHRQCEVCEMKLVRSEGDQSINFFNYFQFGNLLDVMCLHAGMAVLGRQPTIHIPAEARDAVVRLQLPQRYVVVHCTANDPRRNWQAEGWRALVRQLSEGCDIVCLEVGLAPVVTTSATARYIDLCGKVSLIEMAEVIRRARLFIGIDSGPAHIANAVGTHGLILLGPFQDFQQYMPYSGAYQSGENATLLSDPLGLDHLTPETVASAAIALLGAP